MVEGLREIMAELGFKKIEDMVGQSQFLKLNENIDHWKYNSVDLSPLLFKEEGDDSQALHQEIQQDHLMHDILDWKILKAAKPAIESGKKVEASFDVINTDRSVGTMLSNEISKRYKDKGLPEGTITVKLRGSCGQSLGAFMTSGVDIELEGDANDYFGKGLSGGNLCVRPDRGAPFLAQDNIIVGNVCFYGATKGKAFINGIAGERFCVRNSGAEVVVEGIGDHGCEYMTGGRAIILGETGRNFAAGMSGGIAYIYDANHSFKRNWNPELTELENLEDEDDIAYLKGMITEHQSKTGSLVAKAILDDWTHSVRKFVKVMPTDYKKILGYVKEVSKDGQYESEDDIMDAAFEMHLANL